MLSRYLSIAALLLLAGCANMNSMDFLVREDSPLSLAGRVISPATDAPQRRHLVSQIETIYNKDPSPENSLALALVYAVPGEPQTSTVKALALLDKLDTSKLSRSSRLLADWLGNDLAYRESLEKSNARLGHQLSDMKDALGRAREKIEILMRIEQTIGPAPQQDPGGTRH